MLAPDAANDKARSVEAVPVARLSCSSEPDPPNEPVLTPYNTPFTNANPYTFPRSVVVGVSTWAAPVAMLIVASAPVLFGRTTVPYNVPEGENARSPAAARPP